MLIDSSYFFGELHIAGRSQRSVDEVLSSFIAKYEEQYLREMLGYELYKELKTGWEADEPEQKWLDLVDGAEYTDCNGKLQKWDGLRNDGEKTSVIANYVYYWHLRYNAAANTMGGIQEDSSQGSTNVGPGMKQSRAWNEMVDINYRLNDYLQNKKTSGALVYPTYIGCESRDVLCKINVFNL